MHFDIHFLFICCTSSPLACVCLEVYILLLHLIFPIMSLFYFIYFIECVLMSTFSLSVFWDPLSVHLCFEVHFQFICVLRSTFSSFVFWGPLSVHLCLEWTTYVWRSTFCSFMFIGPLSSIGPLYVHLLHQIVPIVCSFDVCFQVTLLYKGTRT